MILTYDRQNMFIVQATDGLPHLCDILLPNVNFYSLHFDRKFLTILLWRSKAVQ